MPSKNLERARSAAEAAKLAEAMGEEEIAKTYRDTQKLWLEVAGATLDGGHRCLVSLQEKRV